MDTTLWQSEQINDLMAAMNRAQLAMLPARKDATNPFFHSKYADLPAVWDALHPFRLEGIVLTQSPMESPDGYIVLETQLSHVSGQWMRSRLKMRVAKDDPQGAGSALTYARRYALGCMTGLVTEEDDDGNAASHSQPTTKNFAEKFPGQAKAIQEKLKPTTAGTPTTTTVSNEWHVPNYGPDAGQPFSAVKTEHLKDYLAGAERSINDPKKANFLQKNEAMREALTAEIAKRETPQEPAAADGAGQMHTVTHHEASEAELPPSRFPAYLDQIELSQSVTECSNTLNTALKDPALTVFETTQLQEASKGKIISLRGKWK